jgi:hypothetical protein
MMRVWRSRVLVALMVLMVPGTANAAAADDWPCVQRKVQDIALAAVWNGPPVDTAAGAWHADPEIAGLVERLAARRTPDDEARQAIQGLAAAAGAAKVRKLTALIEGLVEKVNAERGTVIAGLERFGRAQKQLAVSIRDENAKLSTARTAPDADQVKLTERADHLQWSLRIFNERQKTLRFVCEVPVLIEQRLFNLSRMIEAALK